MSTFHLLRGAVDIKLGPVPGKNICLTFHLARPTCDEDQERFAELQREIVAWITVNMQWTNAEFTKEVHAAHPFIQSKTDEFLMIEFWSSNIENIKMMVTLMRGRFEFIPEDNL
jgi:hypothetical protein